VRVFLAGAGVRGRLEARCLRKIFQGVRVFECSSVRVFECRSVLPLLAEGESASQREPAIQRGACRRSLPTEDNIRPPTKQVRPPRLSLTPRIREFECSSLSLWVLNIWYLIFELLSLLVRVFRVFYIRYWSTVRTRSHEGKSEVMKQILSIAVWESKFGLGILIQVTISEAMIDKVCTWGCI